MNDDFLHSIINDDSENTDVNMDWQHMKALLDIHLPVNAPFVPTRNMASLWLKSLTLIIIMATSFFGMYSWKSHGNIKEKNILRSIANNYNKPADKHNKNINNTIDTNLNSFRAQDENANNISINKVDSNKLTIKPVQINSSNIINNNKVVNTDTGFKDYNSNVVIKTFKNNISNKETHQHLLNKTNQTIPLVTNEYKELKVLHNKITVDNKHNSNSDNQNDDIKNDETITGTSYYKINKQILNIKSTNNKSIKSSVTQFNIRQTQNNKNANETILNNEFNNDEIIKTSYKEKQTVQLYINDTDNMVSINKLPVQFYKPKDDRLLLHNTTNVLAKNKIKTPSENNNLINWNLSIGTQQHIALGGQSNDNYGLSGSSNTLENYMPLLAIEISKNKWSIDLQAAILQPAYVKHQQINSLDSAGKNYIIAKLFQTPISIDLGYLVSNNVKLFMGGGISFNQKAIIKSPMDTAGNSYTKVIKGNVFSTYGLKQVCPFGLVGIEWHLKRFIAGMQYAQGLSPFVNYNNTSQNSHDFQFFLRYEIFRRKKK